MPQEIFQELQEKFKTDDVLEDTEGVNPIGYKKDFKLMGERPKTSGNSTSFVLIAGVIGLFMLSFLKSS